MAAARTPTCCRSPSSTPPAATPSWQPPATPEQPAADTPAWQPTGGETPAWQPPAYTPQQYPQYGSQIISAAKTSFLQGDQWAYTAGIVAILLGAVLVFFCFPKREAEQQLLQQYHDTDQAALAAAA